MGEREEIGAALFAYARREIDATSAGTRVCEAVARAGDGTVRCALLSAESVAVRVLAGRLDDAEETFFADAVDSAGGRRLFSDRRTGDASLWTHAPAKTAWIATEPVTTRRGLYVGALVASGEGDACDTLAVLPGAALVAELIAFELLCQTVLGRRLHRFNNLVARVAANVEQAASLLQTPTADAANDELRTCTRFAFESLRALLDASTDLENALPLGETPLRPRRAPAP